MTSLAYHFASTDKDSWRRPSRTVYGLSERDTYTTIHGAFLSSIFLYIFFPWLNSALINTLFSFFELFFSSVILTDATAYLFDFFLIFFPLSLFLLFIFWHVKYFFLLIHACNLQHKHSHWKIFFFFFFFKHFWSKILPIYISLTFISSSSSATAAFLPSNHSDTSGYIHIKL